MANKPPQKPNGSNEKSKKGSKETPRGAGFCPISTSNLSNISRLCPGVNIHPYNNYRAYLYRRKSAEVFFLTPSQPGAFAADFFAKNTGRKKTSEVETGHLFINTPQVRPCMLPALPPKILTPAPRPGHPEHCLTAPLEGRILAPFGGRLSLGVLTSAC